MARRVTPSQFKSLMQQRIRNINRAIDQVNRANKKLASEYNTAVRKHNAAVSKRRKSYNDAVQQYNRAVTAHNTKVRSDRARISGLVGNLKASTASSYPQVRITTVDVLERYDRVVSEPAFSDDHAALVRLAEVEAANSASVAERLLQEEDGGDPEEEAPSGILGYLEDLSSDLLARWQGAIYALSPRNPDAARHFCTSAREIFTEILEQWADDREVVEADPNCQMTPNGSKPTRRAKIQYLLSRKGAATPEMIGFVEADIENVVQLFNEFNQGTHGAAGKFTFSQLQAIRRRVEGGIMFLATIAA